MTRRIGFRHCDWRFGFLWQSAAQPPARWHGEGEGPANYFADSPVGAWAEFVRHEGITDAADLAGVRRSLWAVELPDDGYRTPVLSTETLLGGPSSYPACRAEARRLRDQGATRLKAPSAALLPGANGGWTAAGSGTSVAAEKRDGEVWVLFGGPSLTGWIAVEAGAPPAQVLPLVRHL